MPVISIFEIWSLTPSGFHLNQPQEACYVQYILDWLYLSLSLTPLWVCTLQPPHLGYFHLSWLLTPLGVAPFTLHTLVIFTSVGYLHHWVAPFTLHMLVIFTSVGYLHHCELHPSPSTHWLFSPQLATCTTELHPSPSTRWLFSPQLATCTTVSCTLHPLHVGYFHLSWLLPPLWVAPFTLHTLVIFTSVGYLHHCELHPLPSTSWLFSPQLATYTTVNCTLHPPHVGYFHLSWLLTPLWVAPFTLHTVIFTSVGYLHHCELHPSPSTRWLFSPQLATYTTELHPSPSTCWLFSPQLATHTTELHPSPSTRWLFSPQLATHTTVSCRTLHPPHLGYFHLSWLPTPLWVASFFTLHTLVIFTSVGYLHHCELHPSPSTRWLFSPQLATYTTVSCCTLHPPHVGYFHLSWLLTPLSCTLHPPHVGYFHLSWLLTPLWVAAPFTLHMLVIFTSVGYSHHCELHPSPSTRLFSPQLATYTTVSCTLHPWPVGYFHLSWLLTPLGVAPFTLHTLVIFTSVGYLHHCELLHPSPSTRWLFQDAAGGVRAAARGERRTRGRRGTVGGRGQRHESRRRDDRRGQAAAAAQGPARGQDEDPRGPQPAARGTAAAATAAVRPGLCSLALKYGLQWLHQC